MSVDTPPPPAAFLTVKAWVAFSSVSRSATYKAMAAGKIRAVKIGGRTLIDAHAGMAWMRSLPPPQLRRSETSQ